MLGLENHKRYQTLELEYVGVKSPQFSYNRLKGADPVAGVEMASTGEVACIGKNLSEAFYASWLATDQRVHGKKVFVSLPDEHKLKMINEISDLVHAGWEVFTTKGTHDFLKGRGIKTKRLHKISDKREPSVEALVMNQKLDLLICVPSVIEKNNDARIIRRLAIDNHIPLITNAEIGRLLLGCLADQTVRDFDPEPWRFFVNNEL